MGDESKHDGSERGKLKEILKRACEGFKEQFPDAKPEAVIDLVKGFAATMDNPPDSEELEAVMEEIKDEMGLG